MTYLPFSPIARMASAVDTAMARSKARRDYQRLVRSEGGATNETQRTRDYFSLALFRCGSWR